MKGGKATARSAPLANFPPGSPRRVLVDVFLQSQARLLVADGDDAGAQVRLSHEALLTHWPRARDQFTADARDLELRGRLEQEAELWRAASRRDKAGRVRASGLPLAEALALCARWRADLPPAITEFVVASRRVARRRRIQRVAGLVGAALSLWVILFLGLMAYGWWQVRALETQMEATHRPVPWTRPCITRKMP